MAFLSEGELRRLEASGEQKAKTLRHPATRDASRLAFSLPPKLLAGLWSTGTASSPVGDLPSEVQEYARRAFKGDRSDLSGDEVLRGTVRLSFGGTPDRPTVWLRLTDGREGSDVNLLYAEGWTREPPEERRREARAHPTTPPRDARFRLKVTLRDPAPRGGIQRGDRPPGAKPLAAFLQDLGRQMDIPILAECEHKLPREDPGARWLRKQWWLAADIVQRPLSEALDLLCADFECEWGFERGFVVVRPRLWFLEPDERGYSYPK